MHPIGSDVSQATPSLWKHVKTTRRSPMNEKKTAEMVTITTDDIFRILIRSVQSILSSAIHDTITFSPMVQNIEKTCLKPDIGCFVLFGGDFNGLVVLNFSGEAAMEIYQKYMTGMGMPQEELSGGYTADEVANSLGELMNQCIGRFRVDLEKATSIHVDQNQPKMLVIPEPVEIAISASIEKPQLRKIAFKTAIGNRFYMEVSLGQINFYSLFPFEKAGKFDVDSLMAAQGR
jgi:CheY-specific phosphatase CheX